ncbi:MAG TPA: response regulator transcription factor [Candidatus Saccharimonadales bacterium]|nr:response regulator transcription factor [Candidatus Saccharimonadales bacterium]
MRILIVEDEHKIANALKRGLEQESYAVDVSYDGDNGMAMATTEPYDAVIIDRMLPGNYDGVDIVKGMREQAIHTPVLLLTAKDSVHDRIHGLDSGADDYLVKPFAFEELLARVRALLRRPQEQLDTKLTYRDITLNPGDYTVSRGGKPILLTHKEFGLLEFLMRNQGRLLSKDMLTQHVWDYDADILPNTVEVYIGYLRTKLEKPFKGAPILHTRRGFGYVFGDKP